MRRCFEAPIPPNRVTWFQLPADTSGRVWDFSGWACGWSREAVHADEQPLGAVSGAMSPHYDTSARATAPIQLADWLTKGGALQRFLPAYCQQQRLDTDSPQRTQRSQRETGEGTMIEIILSSFSALPLVL